jgi:hypothetical protein
MTKSKTEKETTPALGLSAETAHPDEQSWPCLWDVGADLIGGDRL